MLAIGSVLSNLSKTPHLCRPATPQTDEDWEASKCLNVQDQGLFLLYQNAGAIQGSCAEATKLRRLWISILYKIACSNNIKVIS
jgi:hypothetical protein